jgi:Gluconate 2-dehydrogenase subunit 3
MSEITRRDALGRLATAFAAAAAIDGLAARDAHALVLEATAGGQVYQPQALTQAQYRTLERLTDLIIPIEDGRPGAIGAGVPGWIDQLLNVNADLKATYAKGLAWLDATTTARHGAAFADVTPEQQTGLLDQIAFQKNRSPELDPGIDFFILARRMTVDGFYTSPVGMRDLYPGNTARHTFTIPPQAMEYVLDRSPFKTQ